MAKQREAGVSERLMSALRVALPHSFWVKIHMEAMQSAMLDIVGCVQGFYVTIEVKIEGEEPRPRQRFVGLEQRIAGGIVETFTYRPDESFRDQVIDLAERINRKIQQRKERIRGKKVDY